MKRIIKARHILAVSALFWGVMAVQAQEDSYMMTVELSNGTKLSLNTNDVKEVTFADGKVTVTGSDLVQTINYLTRDVEELTVNNEMIKYRIEKMSDSLRYVFDSNQAVKMQVESVEGQIQDLRENGGSESYLWSDSLRYAFDMSSRSMNKAYEVDAEALDRDNRLYDMILLLYSVHGFSAPSFGDDDDDY